MKKLFGIILLQLGAQAALCQWNLHSNGNDIYNTNTGKVGIGISTVPSSKLEVNGTISMVRGNRIQFLETPGGANRAFIEGDVNNSLRFHVGSGAGLDAMLIDPSGNTTIYQQLAVNNGGTISSHLMDTDPNSSWASNLQVRNPNGATNSFSRMTFVSESEGLGAIAVRKTDTYSGDMYLQVRNSAGSFHTPMIIKADGKVGIGTAAPLGTLHVKSQWASLVIDKGSTQAESALLFAKAGSPQFYLWTDNDGGDALKIIANGLSGENDGFPRMEFPLSNKNVYMAGSGGSVGIGTTATGTFKLAVEGKIGAREVNVTIESPWPDYVFEGTYKLLSLPELEQYIKANKHLPDVPTAGEVKAEGLSLGEMNVVLLKKVEELTLYILDQEKRIVKLEKMKKTK